MCSSFIIEAPELKSAISELEEEEQLEPLSDLLGILLRERWRLDLERESSDDDEDSCCPELSFEEADPA